MSNVLPLRRALRWNEVPTPVCFQPGMELHRFNFTDDSYPIFGPGGFVTVIAGVTKPTGLHIWNGRDVRILVSLRRRADHLFAVKSLHVDYPDIVCSRAELQVFGWVCEIFPTGDYNYRTVIWTPEIDARFRRKAQLILPAKKIQL